MKFRPVTFLHLILLCLVFSSCERNPGWDGYKSSNGLEETAEEGCKCVYEVMSSFDSFDTDEVLETLTEYKNRQAGAVAEKFKDVEMAYVSMAAIMDSVDASDCMKPIEDAIFAKGLEYEDVQQVFAAHCKLSAFFRF